MVWTSERIKRLRKAYGETQDAFAQRLRVSVETLRWWEQSKGDPPGLATVVFEQLERDIAATAEAG
jgi:DNA-binding transcriptional regulator YiaG